VEREDVCDVLFRVDQTLRKLKRYSQADEFMQRATAYSSYEDIVRLASEYVEITGVVQPEQADTNRGDDEDTSVFLLDPVSWKILDANQTAAERLGYTVEALTRMSVGDLASPPMAPNGSCSPEARERNQAILRELSYRGRVTFESSHRSSDGTRIPVEVELSMPKQPRRLAVVASVRDISERKRALAALEQAREQLSVAADELGVAVGMQDGNGILCYVNNTSAEMMGYETSELIGKPAAAILHGEDHLVLQQQLKKRRHGILDPYELRNVTKTGNTLHVITAPVPLFNADGGYRGSIGITTLATDRFSLQRTHQQAAAMQHLVDWGTEFLARTERLRRDN
jgi:PAS domain S-box-containing protein